MCKILEILRPANFFEYFDKICIRLIINMLSLNQNSRLFVLVEKSLEVLNFRFGQKYHFVILKNNFFKRIYSKFLQNHLLLLLSDFNFLIMEEHEKICF